MFMYIFTDYFISQCFCISLLVSKRMFESQLAQTVGKTLTNTQSLGELAFRQPGLGNRGIQTFNLKFRAGLCCCGVIFLFMILP